MRKDKKSFFERLTGTIKVEEGDHEIEETSDAGQTNWTEEEEREGQLTVDVFQTPDHIVIKTMVAGVRPDDLDVSITRDMVTIRGKREEEKNINDDDYFFRELYWGSFSRSVMLPQEVEVDSAEASERNGLLTIKLSKIDKGRQTKLRIKSNS
jgi:HSP20 family protein